MSVTFALVLSALGNLTVSGEDIVSVTSYPGSRADPETGSANEADIVRERSWNVQGDSEGRYLHERAVTLELVNGDRYDVIVPTGKTVDDLVAAFGLSEVRADARGRCREWRRVRATIERNGHTYDTSGRRLKGKAPASSSSAPASSSSGTEP